MRRAPLPRAVLLVAEEHRGEEALGVVGALVTDLVAGQLIAPSGCELLQPRLVVLPAGADRLFADPALERGIALLAQRPLGRVRKMSQQMMRKLAPAKFRENPA